MIPNWLTELRQLTASLSASLADRYRIERELGAGGMATVYLAHDLKHDRDVAIKVLRPELAAVIGAERFLSEIKTTANLQHPHILPLFDSGEADGFLFYVMPFIEGESLRNRLAREKQLPITDAVRIATEVAGALDYAHRHNVIHRDIKPENILLHDGRALVADFGIALAAQEARGARMTQTGLSLGTPQYMSPEQAMGERQIDGRTDVYALGAMLYEMLTGEPPFGGASGQAIVAKMMTERPTPPSTVRETVPDAVEAAVLTALAKLPADRFTSAAQFADALAVAEARGPAAESRARSPRAARSHVRLAAIALAALLIGVAAGFWGSWLRRPRSDEGVLRTMIAFPSGQELEAAPQGNSFVLSRDGSVLVYWGRATGDIHQLWSRRLDQLNATPIRGTEGGVLPVLSPDGRQVAFETLTDRKIRVVPIEGGVPRIVVDSARRGGVDWAADGMLYYRATSDGLSRVPAAGGASEKLTQSGTDAGVGGIGYFWPQALPRGRSLIASFRPSSGDDAASRIVAIPLETGKPIDIVAGVYARYAPTGHLVWATADGTVYAAPFNARTFALGAPTLLLEHVRVESAFGSADFSFSDHGRLLYQLGDASGGDLVWVSRAGTIVPLGVDGMQAGLGAGMRVSPDGRSLAVSRVFGTELDVWVKSLPDGALTRLTTSGSPNLWPAWTPDGRYVSFLRRGALYKRAADGTGTDSLVLSRPTAIMEAAWSPDGQWLALVEAPSRLVLLRRGDSTVRALSEGARFAEAEPRFSPDSRWLAYTSAESGQSEVYVQPFPDVNAGKWQVSLGGGTSPRWSHTGHELFYRTKGSARLMSATISTSPTFSIVRRDSLTTAATQAAGFNAEQLEVGANDQQFLVIRSRGQGQGLVIVEHWFDDLLHNARP